MTPQEMLINQKEWKKFEKKSIIPIMQSCRMCRENGVCIFHENWAVNLKSEFNKFRESTISKTRQRLKEEIEKRISNIKQFFRKSKFSDTLFCGICDEINEGNNCSHEVRIDTLSEVLALLEGKK